MEQSVLMKFKVGDIIQIAGDKRRIGLIVKDNSIHNPMFLVQFFDPIFKSAWYHDDMLKKVK
jgi:hypothetical protein